MTDALSHCMVGTRLVYAHKCFHRKDKTEVEVELSWPKSESEN